MSYKPESRRDTDLELKIDTQSHVLSETAFVVLKMESYGVEGEQVQLLAFWGQLEGYELNEVGVND